ncbi:bicyclomycin resistance protein [Desulfosporosinus acididurans]|uniref:Bcr/CflA family efflux transporter n=1 Tax=Desulfosporosinus acididurans TaxID=476652 RepID=A0A0J1FSU3_9FIRM|nr:multidrug effflux MFS transporter [Desulfosporosinus acididurans]KLU66534.1 bicyclomycin resistance protein [Desulfosporosinus acididurans]
MEINDLKKQKYLGDKGMIVLIAVLSAFIPLSMDVYLPALPTMTEYFRASQSIINLTLIMFFIFFGFGTLFWGPLSDKHGRKPIVLIGLSIYTVASFLCSLSSSVYLLIAFRALQAFGGGAASSVATALVKDVYSGRKRESVLAVVQSMVVISPAVAPVVGSFLLNVTSWRGVFVAQALIGISALAGSLALQETIVEKSSASVMRTIGRLGVVLKNMRFTSLLLIFSTMSIPALAFITASSYIYQENFHLSSQVYSYYFAFNALGMLFGPLIYIRLSNYYKRTTIINTCFALTIISGLLISLVGSYSPPLFAVTLVLSTVSGSAMRPPSAFLMLEQQQGDTGSVSSLMGSFATVMGSVGMGIVSLSSNNQIAVIGVLNIILGLICGAVWLYLSSRPYLKQATAD